MINKNTVFILGAGASCPFGFPTGKKLLDDICQSIQLDWIREDYPTFPFINNTNKKRIQFGSKISDNFKISPKFPNHLKIFEECGFAPDFAEKFSEDLKMSGKNSVDAFLERRSEFTDLGKCLIVRQIQGHENLNELQNNSDWYQYIWDIMSDTTFDDFNKNEISFATFNYDISLETFLLYKMHHLYNKSLEDCYQKLLGINIIHLHGKTGALSEGYKEYMKFGKRINDAEKLMATAKSIKIIHDNFDLNKDKDFKKTYKILSRAEKVIILGLGYNETNLRRLKIEKIGVEILGSSMGMTLLECENKMKQFPNIKLNKNTEEDCLSFLKNNVTIE